MSYASLLSNTATITRRSTTNNGPEPGTTSATVASNVPCRVQWMTAQELSGAFDPSVAQVRIYFAYGTDILTRDRCTIDGRVYELQGVDFDTAGAGHHIEVYAKVIQ
jgi:head-tail adaptor